MPTAQYSTTTAGLNEFTAYGEPGGETVLEYVEGPYAQSTIYSIYGSQDAAVLALKKGDIDFMLNPLGLSKGLQEQLTGEDGLTTIENASNGVRYLGFNIRRAPMDEQGLPAGRGNADRQGVPGRHRAAGRSHPHLHDGAGGQRGLVQRRRAAHREGADAPGARREGCRATQGGRIRLGRRSRGSAMTAISSNNGGRG